MRLSSLIALCCLSGCLSPMGGGTASLTDDDSSSSSESTDATPTTVGPTTGDTSTGPDDTSTTDPSTTGPGFCGDGILSGDEQCDNGDDNADDAACLTTCALNVCGDGFMLTGSEACDDGNGADDDACLSTCELARCGDAKIQDGVETCDDGTNDGAYDGCTADCAALGPHCGDGLLDDPQEECDDDEDPACLTSCKLARSCDLLLAADSDLESGTYVIYPTTPDLPVSVHCDMTTDGGGYTFLKVDVESEANNLPYPAANAETKCAEYGMRLWIPRSPEHLVSGYTFATSANLPPVGGGDNAAGADYLRILAVYPVTDGVSCPGMPLTPGGCPEWDAGDHEDWYITDTSTSLIEPDPDGACPNCSMSYVWNGDGTVKTYKAVPNGGSSFRFLCDIGDKLP
jgi:cysteine-rich repeat protein